MKVLITAFEPFDGEEINPSMALLEKLESKIGSKEIIKLTIPTVFNESLEIIKGAIKTEKPDVLISIGQAAGRDRISLERVGININHARIPDNKGNQPNNEIISETGADGYFSTLPLTKMEEAIKKKEIPVEISNTAGTYVCNHVLYGALEYIKRHNLDIRSGFIHIPYIPSQVLDKPKKASMALGDMVCAVTEIVEVL